MKPEYWTEALPEIEIPPNGEGRKLHGWLGAGDYYGSGSIVSSPEREWWIYALQGEDGGPIKIGRSTNLIARVSEVGIGYPFGRLRFVGLCVGVKAREKEIHARFAHLSIRGEWFAPAADLLNFIRTEMAESPK